VQSVQSVQRLYGKWSGSVEGLLGFGCLRNAVAEV
jgi:hypothetical protein